MKTKTFLTAFGALLFLSIILQACAISRLNAYRRYYIATEQYLDSIEHYEYIMDRFDFGEVQDTYYERREEIMKFNKQ